MPSQLKVKKEFLSDTVPYSIHATKNFYNLYVKYEHCATHCENSNDENLIKFQPRDNLLAYNYNNKLLL